MAKKNQKELENDIFGRIAKEVGGSVLSDMEDDCGFLDTGILGLNYIISNSFMRGWGVGSISELSGLSGCGKSLLSANFCRGGQKANAVMVYHDAENALNKNFIKRTAKVDPNKMIVTTANTLEASFNRIQNSIRLVRENGVPLERAIGIVYDSLTVSSSEKEFVETTVDMDSVSDNELKRIGGSRNTQVAERARICNSELRKLMPVVKSQRVAMIFISQMRVAIGQYSPSGPPLETSGGGMALKYYASTRVKMSPSKMLMSGEGVLKKPIGNLVNFKCTKSRFTAPNQELKGVRLLYESGIDPFGGLLTLMLQIERVKQLSAGNYLINPQYTDGKEVKFKAKMDDNLIPTELLLEYPSLVDGTTADVQYYVDNFSNALENMKEIGQIEDIKGEDLEG